MSILQDAFKRSTGKNLTSYGRTSDDNIIRQRFNYVSEQTRRADITRQQEHFNKEKEKADKITNVLEGLNIVPNFFNALNSQYKEYPKKIKEDIKAASENLAKGEWGKGLFKAGVRTAGDTAIMLFAPISSAIGTVMQAFGGQKLIDKTGEVIADKTGITDWKLFQKFAMEHPNAGEDFERVLMLATVGMDKGKIEPKRMVQEVTKMIDHIKNPPIKLQVQSGGTTDIPLTKIANKMEPVRTEGVPKNIAEAKALSKTKQIPTHYGSRVDISQTSKHIVAEAKKLGLEIDIKGIPKIERIKLINERAKSYDFIKKDPAYAKEVVFNKKTPPEGIIRESVFIEMKRQALKDGDVALINELSKSTIGTEAAQALKALDDTWGTADPVRVIKEIRKTGQARAQKRLGSKTTVSKEVSTIKKQITSEISKINKTTKWETFVKSIQC